MISAASHLPGGLLLCTHHPSLMKKYLANRWFKVGFWLAVIGCGPLLAIVGLAAIGLWPDPDPNPVGLGLLFFISFWPACFCLVIGGLQVRGQSEA